MSGNKLDGSARYDTVVADDIYEGFPDWIAADDPAGNEVIGALVAGDAVEPAPQMRARLLAALDPTGRFERFVPAVSEMLDLPDGDARALLDRLHDASVWDAGPVLGPWSTWWVDGGPKTERAIRGFLRIKAGTDFPHHAHLGDEVVLVLQGSFVDSDGTEVIAGTIARMPEGSNHEFRVAEVGPDLLLLTVVWEGIRMTDGPTVRFDGTVSDS